jgi:hypothetical protein
MKKNLLQKNDLLSAKLLSYSAAAGALLAVGQDAEAQIAYTDVDPDSVVVAPEVESQDIFAIDMNNDGITDVTIVAGDGDWYYSMESYSYHWKSIRALNGTGGSVAVQSTYLAGWSNPGPTFYLAKRFDQDAIIGPDESFMTSSWSIQLGFVGESSGSTYNSGLWNDGETDKYLGIRFSLDDGVSYHYGWVRLDVAEDHSQVTVKDYAYQTKADLPIVAGATVNTSVRNGLANDLGVNISSYQNKIVISDLEIDHATADVYNVAGQLLHTVQVEKGRNEVPVDNKGLYIVRIDLGGEIVSSKVIVQ